MNKYIHIQKNRHKIVAMSRNVGLFTRFAQKTASITGRPGAFIGAVLLIVVWVLSGPVFGFSDTWQLVVNTGTTIITFLMVFLVQSTQNRDTTTIQLKLDELIMAVKDARNEMIDIEMVDDSQIESRKREMVRVARFAKANGRTNHSDMREK